MVIAIFNFPMINVSECFQWLGIIFQSTHSTIASVEKIKLRTVTQPQTESYPVEEELVSTPINNM